MPSLTVTLPIPPSTNNLYTNGRGRRVLTTEARNYKTLAAYQVKQANDTIGWHYTPKARLRVELKLFFADNRRRDIANCEKLPVDAVAETLGFDDCVIDKLTIERAGIDKANPRCELTVEEL